MTTARRIKIAPVVEMLAAGPLDAQVIAKSLAATAEFRSVEAFPKEKSSKWPPRSWSTGETSRSSLSATASTRRRGHSGRDWSPLAAESRNSRSYDNYLDTHRRQLPGRGDRKLGPTTAAPPFLLNERWSSDADSYAATERSTFS